MPTIAFKEWSLVCAAMGSGKQSLILRKGGIHEGKSGFALAHDSFYLFPTAFHAQNERLIEDYKTPPTWHDTRSPEERGEVEVRFFCEVVEKAVVQDWGVLEALAPYHGWTEDIVRERFEWGGETPEIHAALVRVSALKKPWVFPFEKKYGGCRSWLEIPEPGEQCLPAEPVVGDPEFGELAAEVRALLG